MLSHPWRLSRLGSHFGTRGSLARCPSLNPIEMSTISYILAGVRVACGSASLALSWCWDSQLKAHSWQCSLLAPEHPQQCAVDPEGMSLDGLCDALEEKDLTLKVFRVYSGTFHCVPLPRKQTFPKALVIPKNQRWALKSAAVFWIFSVNKIWPQVLKEPRFTRPGILIVVTALRKYLGWILEKNSKHSWLSGTNCQR